MRVKEKVRVDTAKNKPCEGDQNGQDQYTLYISMVQLRDTIKHKSVDKKGQRIKE